jgi:Mo-nitrogenase MoFe protein subunit NifK (EC 1.18.6.1)
MSQSAEKIQNCHPLFEQDAYQMLFKDKRQLEEAHDPARVQEVFQWTTTAEYEALNFQREALTIDPAKACQPLGAVLCSLGFANTLPYVHGSQGCVAYFRTYFNRHFKEPIACVSDSMTEDAAVFGGNNNLNTGLQNASALYKPEIIAVSTTCMAEVIGDDLQAFIANAKKTALSTRRSRCLTRTRQALSAAISPAGTICSRALPVPLPPITAGNRASYRVSTWSADLKPISAISAC